MYIYRMMSSNVMTQGFGVSKACVYPNRKVVPKFGSTCRAGTQDLYASMNMKAHNGVDYGCYKDEPIYFSTRLHLKNVPEGKFLRDMTWWANTEVDRAGGIGVDVISKEKVMIGKALTYIKFRFWHLNASLVSDGQEIKFGDRIGLGGSTGLSSGNHLHFGYKFCLKDGTAINKGNGYYGGLDPEPYMQNASIVDYKRIDEKLTLPQQFRKLAYLLIKVNFDVSNVLNKVAEIIEKQGLKVGSIIRSLNK